MIKDRITGEEILKISTDGILSVPIVINKLNPSNIKEVIFSPPATIVKYTDGSKTVVKTKEGEEFDPEVGFAMAMMKEMFNGRSGYKKFIARQKFVEKKGGK